MFVFEPRQQWEVPAVLRLNWNESSVGECCEEWIVINLSHSWLWLHIIWFYASTFTQQHIPLVTPPLHWHFFSPCGLLVVLELYPFCFAWLLFTNMLLFFIRYCANTWCFKLICVCLLYNAVNKDAVCSMVAIILCDIVINKYTKQTTFCNFAIYSSSNLYIWRTRSKLIAFVPSRFTLINTSTYIERQTLLFTSRWTRFVCILHQQILEILVHGVVYWF